MGYRLYLGKISKEEHDKIQIMSYPYIAKKYGKKFGDETYVSNYHLVEKIYEFGKYYDAPEGLKFPFFADTEIQSRFSGDFWVVTRGFLECVIEQERAFLENYYKEKSEKSNLNELQLCLNKMSREWKLEPYPYNLDLEKDHLVDSWHRGFQIFDLVRIYKTFDFDSDLLIYYGW